jgi:hypothetical protein
MERVVEDEWLDEDRGTPEEVAAALDSVNLANRRFGGVRLHARLFCRALARMPRSHRPHILEVASGRADVLQAALQRTGVMADVTLLDRSAAHLPDPRAWLAKLPAPRVLEGNALALPFPDRSRISRHDGPASVRRAYTCRELSRMLEKTGRSFLLERAYLYRLGAVLWCGERSHAPIMMSRDKRRIVSS